MTIGRQRRQGLENDHGGHDGLHGSAGKRTLSEQVQRKAAGTAPPVLVSAPRADDHAPSGDASFLDSILGPAVQRKEEDGEGDELEAEEMHALAAEGVAGAGGELPHREAIEQSFGRDLGGVTAHVGGAGGAAAGMMGATAFATGSDVAFQGAPDLHTAAHEAAHVIQQQAGVQLKGGVGEVGDRYEREADQVADLVVAGQSAAPILASYGHGQGHAAPAVQHDKPKVDEPKAKAPAPTPISGTEAHEHLKEGQDGKLGLETTKAKAADLYEIVLLQAQSKAIHDQVTKAYDAATKTRDKMLEKSTLEQVMGAIGTLIEFGVGIYSIIGAAQQVYTAAKGLSDTYKTYQEVKGLPAFVVDPKKEALKKVVEHGKSGGGGIVDGGKAVGSTYTAGKSDGGGGGAKPLDPNTMLPNVNAEAIRVSNAALDALMEGGVKLHLTDVHGDYKAAALNVAQMTTGVDLVNKQNQVMPPASLEQFHTLVKECAALQKEILTMLQRLQSVWVAYQAGGAEALSDKKERGLFEKIQGWRASGDPKANALRVAMDQSHKHIKFLGTRHRQDSFNVEMSTNTLYHYYDEEPGQAAQGTLYISDPAVSNELIAAGLASGDASFGAANGAAENAADEHKSGIKHTVSISMCKALISLGVFHWYKDATVHFWNQGTWGGNVVKRHIGDWYEKDWMDTPEFTTFWTRHLEGRYANVGGGPDTVRRIAGATPDAVERGHKITMRNTKV